jgi:hypothetical protein
MVITWRETFVSVLRQISPEGVTMNDKLVQLKAEFQKGQQQMAFLERRRQELRDTMLRISGAIQVLEELQDQAAQAERDRQIASAAA